MKRRLSDRHWERVREAFNRAYDDARAGQQGTNPYRQRDYREAWEHGAKDGAAVRIENGRLPR